MARYEVWDKKKLGVRKATPEDTFFTLDNGIAAAKKLSVGTWEHHEVDWSGKNPKDFKIQVPNMMALIERGACQSIIRGYGIDGQWKDAVANCKRCNNTGMYPQRWTEENCPSCKGASFKPKI
jgi:hypothetical protein